MTRISETVEKLIQYEGTLTILIGAGASREAVRRNGEPIPGYKDVQNDFLTKHGIQGLSDTEREAKFLELAAEHEEHILEIMRELLSGYPNAVHIEFLSFCLARVRERRGHASLILTTNFDSLIEDAHRAVAHEDEIIKPISFSRYDDHAESLSEAKKHLTRGRIVVAHLWGDFSYSTPIFSQEKMTFQEPVTKFLRSACANPILAIGYSFGDPTLVDLVNQKSKYPVYVVSRSDTTPKFKNREFRLLDCRFSDFMKEANSHILANSPIRKYYLSNLSNFEHFRGLAESDVLLGKLQSLSSLCLQRLMKKLPRGGVDTTIARSSVETALADFISSNCSLFALVGEAGMGKSTFIYRNAIDPTPYRSTLILTLDPGYFTGEKTFANSLSQDFSFPQWQLHAWFSALNAHLAARGQRLLIQIDAINEIESPTPEQLRNELEKLAESGVLGQRVKILYSCREIYWKTDMDTDIPSELYFHDSIHLIERFSQEEAPKAFAAYSAAYGLLGDWYSLDEHFREHLSDPLLMHLMAEAYEGGPIPLFAPALSVFGAYLKKLENKKSTNKFPFESALIDIAKHFLNKKAGYVVSGKRFRFDSDIFNAYSIYAKQSVYSVLSDERIIHQKALKESDAPSRPASKNTNSREFVFVYDRFFEYTLGRAFIELYQLYDGYTFEKIADLIAGSRSEFSLLQGLKSALVNLTCGIDEKSQDGSLLTDLVRLRKLVNHNVESVREFTKLCLQEILAENRGDGFAFVEEAFENRERFLGFVVEYCADNMRASPQFVEIMLSGNPRWFDNARMGILLNFLTEQRRERVISELERRISGSPSISADQLIGLIFILSLFLDERIKVDDAGLEVLRVLRKLIGVSHNRHAFESALTGGFIMCVKQYSDNFFSTDKNHDNLSYLWSMNDDVKEMAQRLPSLFRKAHSLESFTSEDIDTLRFFCSDIKNPADLSVTLNQPDPCVFSYRIEHILSRYCILKLAYMNADAGMEILRQFMKSNYWFSIDSALCLAQRIALFKLDNNEPEGAKDILHEMEEWMDGFAAAQPQNFFRTLDSEEPLNETYNPLNQVAMVEGHIYSYQNEIPVFKRGISQIIEAQKEGAIPAALDIQYAKLNILSIRKMIRIFPDASLRALGEALKVEGDVIPRKWLEDTLGRLAQTYPKKVKLFLEDNGFSELSETVRALAKEIPPDIAGQEWDHDQVAKYFLLSPSLQRLDLFLEWYEKAFRTYDIESYLTEMARAIIRTAAP